MRRFSLLLLTFVIAGCVSPNTKQTTSATGDREPHFKFLWHDQVSSKRYLDKFPQEFAAPHHVRSEDRLVVATSEGWVQSHLAANGDRLWEKKVGASFLATPTSGDGLVFAANVEGDLFAFDGDNGEQIWTKSLGVGIESALSFHKGRLFVVDVKDSLSAFDAASGEVLWTRRREMPKFFTIQGGCVPVFTPDAVICGAANGNLEAVQIDTGEVLWTQNLTDGQTEFVDIDRVELDGDKTFWNFSKNSMVTGMATSFETLDVSAQQQEGGIYAASFAGGLFKLGANGETIWHLKARSIADFTLGVHRIFIATSAGEIAAVDKADGTVHWRFKMDTNLPTQIKRFGDYLIVPTSGGEVYLFDAFSGHVFEKWVGSSDAFLSEITFGANRFYGFSNAGRLVAFKMGW